MSIPIIFKSLYLRNFISFGQEGQEIDLTQPGSVLVLGENKDVQSQNGQTGANGVGKSAIINGLCYVCFNKPFDNISLQRLINTTNATKNTLMEAKVIFDKGDDEYEIYRCRGESFNIRIMKNGLEITLDSVSENDKLIEEILGISYELFTRIIVFSGNSIQFLDLPVSAQRNQIEELFNITLLSEKAVKLRDLIKTTESNISIQSAVVKEKEIQLANHVKQVKAAEERITKWEGDRGKQLETITTQIEKYSGFDFVSETEIHAGIAEVDQLINPLNSKLTIAKRDSVTLTNDIKKLEKEITHLIDDKCPYCLQNYEGSHDKLGEKKEVLDKKQDSFKSVEEKITSLLIELQEIESTKSLAISAATFPSLESTIKAETVMLTANEKLKDLEQAVNPHFDAYEQLLAEKTQEVSYSEIDELRKDLEHQQFLLKLLVDKNSFIRRKIINRTIPFLNTRLIEYTKELGLPHLVKFDDDMSCSVSEYGRELDYGNLSSGEKKRVNFSLSMAFRDVLHHLHAKVNCLFLDEIDGSLDISGVDNIFKLLKTKTRDDNLNTWIISHRPEAIGRFDRTVVVRKENGFSKIITGDME